MHIVRRLMSRAAGIGYGKSFRIAANTGGGGNAEYRDVLAAGKYLQGRPDVNPAIPDDTHETLLHRRWLYTFGRVQDFLKRFLWNRNAATGAAE